MFGVALTIIVWAISTSDGIVEAVFVLLDFSNPEHTGRSILVMLLLLPGGALFALGTRLRRSRQTAIDADSGSEPRTRNPQPKAAEVRDQGVQNAGSANANAPTLEGVTARSQRVEQMARKAAAISDGVEGEFPCPVCGGNVVWGVAQNGHLHVRCETSRCVDMME